MQAVEYPEYGTWCAMKQRCYNPNASRYERYGGRGIKVCDLWVSNFWRFLADVGPRPSSDHSIDRINNGGDYEPGNVRWATAKQQAANRSAARLPSRPKRVPVATQPLRPSDRDSAITSAAVITRFRGSSTWICRQLGVNKTVFSHWLHGRKTSSQLDAEVPALVEQILRTGGACMFYQGEPTHA